MIIKDGEEGFKKLFSETFSNVNIEEGKGKEIYNQLLQGAQASAASLAKAGIDAGNALRNVQNEQLKNNLELVKAQKEALSGLSDKLKALKEGPNVDPLALFEKFKKATELINSGKAGDVQRGNEILIGAGEEIANFKAKFGEKSLQDLQERAITSGRSFKSEEDRSKFINSQVSKATEVAALSNINFDSIIKKLTDSSRFETAAVARNVAANPTQAGIGELINLIRRDYANTTGRERQEGSDMVGSLLFGGRQQSSIKNINDSLKKELDLSLVEEEDRKK